MVGTRKGSLTVVVSIGVEILSLDSPPVVLSLPISVLLMVHFSIAMRFRDLQGCVSMFPTLGDASLCIFGISYQSNIFIEFGNQIS